MKIEDFVKYCTGCGMCHSLFGIPFVENDKGFRYPKLTYEEKEFCNTYCPAGHSHFNKVMDNLDVSPWGEIKEICLGWSNDHYIRFLGSSGGVLSEVCVYLLEKGKVDGIIQVKKSTNLIETEVVISRNKEDVLSCAGSRYTVSSPLESLNYLMIPGERYAFVGKPCDVSVLRLFKQDHKHCFEQIVFFLSFFCAGQPSVLVNKKLISLLGCTIDECADLNYRGRGWPGRTVVRKKDGTENSFSYNESWGKVLGRDIRPYCRFCLDGIGLFADICCGDAWYIEKNGKPDLAEHDGRNIIIARNNKGLSILKDMKNEGRLFLDDGANYLNYLSTVQSVQLDKKIFMTDMISTMRHFNYPTPDYQLDRLKKYKVIASPLKRYRRIVGTLRRIITGTFD